MEMALTLHNPSMHTPLVPVGASFPVKVVGFRQVVPSATVLFSVA